MRTYVTFLGGFVAGALSLLGLLYASGLVTREPRVVQVSRSATPTAAPVAASSAPVRPAPPATAAAPPPVVATSEVLKDDSIVIPVAGVKREDLHDHFNDLRGGGRPHHAIDIMAAKGTPVLAAVDGQVRKLFISKQGGITIYQYDRDSNFVYYYAHLDRYADGLAEKQELKRGDVIGYVGTTGNAPPGAPHLHFSVDRLPPTKEWWKGDPINPYPLLAERGVTYRIEQ